MYQETTYSAFWSLLLCIHSLFIAVSLLVSGSIRDLLIKQIGSNRIAVLRQIGERANLIKTSSTTLSNLYTHEIISHDFLNKPLSEREHKKAWEYLDSQKKIYDEIIGPIGHEVVIWGENGFFTILERSIRIPGYTSPGIKIC